MANWLNFTGLIFDILGVVLLFKYGLPSKVTGTQYIIGAGEINDPDVISENRKIRKRAYIGITLLLVGFLFQLSGSLANIFYNDNCQLPKYHKVSLH